MRRNLHVVLAVAVITPVLGCSTASPTPASLPVDQSVSATQPAPATQPPSASRRLNGTGRSHGGRPGGRGGAGGSSPQPAAAMPVGVPLPSGLLTAVDRGPGRWSALVVVRGSAQKALASAVAFYVGHAFHRDSTYAVHGRGYRISMIAANRDHSATETNLTVVVERQN